MNIEPLLTSNNDEWETPPEIFSELDKEFNFTLDPCCFPETAKCEKYYTPIENGLLQDWTGQRVFMNPPYGRQIGLWIKKAYEESVRGTLVVCLIPARTDTAYWHDYVMKAKEIRYIRGRLKFHLGGKKINSAPFPSAIIVFGGLK